MRIAATGSALVTTAVVRAVTGNTVVPANRLTAVVRTLTITGAGPTDTHRAATGGSSGRAPNGRADIARAFQAAAAIRPAVAGSAFVSATVEGSVARDAVVSAGNRTTILVTLAGRRALPAETNGTTTGCRPVGAHAALAPHVAAALRIGRATAATAAAAIQRPRPVISTRDRAACLAALTRL